MSVEADMKAMPLDQYTGQETYTDDKGESLRLHIFGQDEIHAYLEKRWHDRLETLCYKYMNDLNSITPVHKEVSQDEYDYPFDVFGPKEAKILEKVIFVTFTDEEHSVLKTIMTADGRFKEEPVHEYDTETELYTVSYHVKFPENRVILVECSGRMLVIDKVKLEEYKKESKVPKCGCGRPIPRCSMCSMTRKYMYFDEYVVLCGERSCSRDAGYFGDVGGGKPGWGNGWCECHSY